MANMDIAVVVGLVDRLSKPIAGIERRIKGLSRLSADLSVGGAAGVASGMALAAPLRAATEQAMALEDAMADVRKVVDFETPEGPAELQAQLEALTRTIPLTAEQLANIAAAGGQLGLSAPELPDYVETAAKAATAFDMLAADAGQAFAKLSNVFGIPIPEIGRLGDAINHLSNNTAAAAPELVNVLTRIGGSAAAFGLSAEAAAAYGAAMIALGETPETAGTAINFMLSRLQTAQQQTPKFKDALAQLGLTASELQQAIGEDAAGALDLVLGKLAELPSADRMGALVQMFGTEHAPKLAKLANNLGTVAEVQGLVAEQSQYAGSMQAEFAARAETTSNALQLASNRIAELQRAIGNNLLPVIVQALGHFAGVADRVRAWTEANPELTRTVVMAGAALAGLLVVGGGLGIVIGGLLGGLATLGTVLVAVAKGAGLLLGGGAGLVAMLGRIGVLATLLGRVALTGLIASVGRLAATFAGLGAALLANPITWVVLGIVAAVAAAVWVFRNWETVVQTATDVYRRLVEWLGFDPLAAMSAAWGGVLDWFDALWSDISAGFEAGVLQGIANLITTANPVALLASAIRTAMPDAVAAMGELTRRLMDVVRDIGERMVQIGADIISGLKRGIQQAWEGFTGWFREKMSWIPGVAKEESQVRSPSRVFAAIGSDLMAGLRVGIDRAVQLPMDAARGAAAALASVPLTLAPVAAAAMPAPTPPELPQLQLPGVSAPELPQLQLPGVSAPELPQLQLPGIGAPELPRLRWPDVEAPELPQLQWPARAMPSVATPPLMAAAAPAPALASPQLPATAPPASGARSEAMASVSMPVTIHITAGEGAGAEDIAAAVRDAMDQQRERLEGALYDHSDGL